MDGRPLLTDEHSENLLRLVKYKVWLLMGPALKDRQDVAQDVFIRVLERLPYFDPGRSSLPTFLNRLVNQACIDCRRRFRAAKRGGRKTIHSLSGDSRISQALGGLLGDDRRGVSGKRRKMKSELDDLQLDLATATAALNADDQALCERLKQQSVADVAADRQVDRGTVYRRLRILRKQFEDRGLAAYLD